MRGRPLGIAGAQNQWSTGLAIGSSPSSSRSAAPDWDSGTWVFDDERVGLVREPFVLRVPDMIDHLVRDIPDAREGSRMSVVLATAVCLAFAATHH